MLGAIRSQMAKQGQFAPVDENQQAGHSADERAVDHQPALGDVHDAAQQRAQAAAGCGERPGVIGPILDDVERAGADDARHDHPKHQRVDRLRLDADPPGPPDSQGRGEDNGQEHHHAVAADGQSLSVVERRQHPDDDRADHQQDGHVTPSVGVEALPPRQPRQQPDAKHRPDGQQQAESEQRPAGDVGRYVEEGLVHD